jgi:hypothetical protein
MKNPTPPVFAAAGLLLDCGRHGLDGGDPDPGLGGERHRPEVVLGDGRPLGRIELVVGQAEDEELADALGEREGGERPARTMRPEGSRPVRAMAGEALATGPREGRADGDVAGDGDARPTAAPRAATAAGRGRRGRAGGHEERRHREREAAQGPVRRFDFIRFGASIARPAWSRRMPRRTGGSSS